MTTFPRELEAEMVQFFGPVGTQQVELFLPYPMTLAWPDTRGVYREVNRILCHAHVRDSLGRILEQTLDHYGIARVRELRLNVFGGCLNVRRKRGSTSSWSVHAWGAAVDIDPANNQLRWGRDRARLAQPEYEPFWEIVEKQGWTSLGRKKNYDWMHFQAASLP